MRTWDPMDAKANSLLAASTQVSSYVEGTHYTVPLKLPLNRIFVVSKVWTLEDRARENSSENNGSKCLHFA